MYQVERMMKVLQGYVHSMARFEESMAKGYVLEETLGFVTKYMHEFEHVSRRVWDVKEEEGVSGEVLEGASPELVLNNTYLINLRLYQRRTHPWVVPLRTTPRNG